jgi:hypothetical protein
LPSGARRPDVTENDPKPEGKKRRTRRPGVPPPAEPAQAETTQTEAASAGPTKAEPTQTEPAQVETVPRHVFRWDLDKTYLKSDFDTFRDLWRSAFEKAEAKQAIPGAAALVRECRKLAGARVTFISGSPEQMRKVLTRKLELDGVEFDEFILKANLKNLLRGRFRALREQVGYKLPALLADRARCAPTTQEVCFGDDAEADAFVYSLYADLLAGNIGLSVLEEILTLARVYPDDASRTLALAGKLERSGAVSRIFIHLDRRSPAARFHKYGRRLVPVFNYLQAGLVLVDDALLGADAAATIAREMLEKFEYTLLALRNSVEDLLRRGHIGRQTVEHFALACKADELLGPLAPRLRTIDALAAAPPADEPIDYVAAFAQDARRERKKPPPKEEAF